MHMLYIRARPNTFISQHRLWTSTNVMILNKNYKPQLPSHKLKLAAIAVVLFYLIKSFYQHTSHAYMYI